MGNEISMKEYGIALLLLANLASFASDTQSEIEGYEDKFAAINKERKGLDASDLNKLSDPFLKTKGILRLAYLNYKLYSIIKQRLMENGIK